MHRPPQVGALPAHSPPTCQSGRIRKDRSEGERPYRLIDPARQKTRTDQLGNNCNCLIRWVIRSRRSPVYDVVEAFNGNRYFLLQKGQKFGIAGSDGRIILPVEFDNLLLNRYDKEAGITFPLLGYRSEEWNYYTENGDVLQVEGTNGPTWSVKTGLW